MKLWGFETGAGMNSPAMAFKYDGGSTSRVVRRHSFVGSARGESLWSFGLDGRSSRRAGGHADVFLSGVHGAGQRRRRTRCT